MEQKSNLADVRLLVGCTYCGGPEDTRDHVPSRVLLEPPYPENLPVVASCAPCNRGFSSDEEYFACLIEAVLAGSTDPEEIQRPAIASAFRRSPALRARLQAARALGDRGVQFEVEEERVANVVKKLARGHAAFELSQPCRGEPVEVWWCPLMDLAETRRDEFEAGEVVGLFGEIGSRQMQRLVLAQVVLESAGGDRQNVGVLLNNWVDVQDGYYRYFCSESGGRVSVRIVVREYLACGVTWVN